MNETSFFEKIQKSTNWIMNETETSRYWKRNHKISVLKIQSNEKCISSEDVQKNIHLFLTIFIELLNSS